MEARAITRFVHLSPMRARLVADLIRGQRVGVALQILDATPRRAAGIIKKTLMSAVANATSSGEGAHVDADDLIVKTAMVDGGPMMKRFMPRAMGRATRVRKRLAHVTIVVGDLEGTRPKREEATRPKREKAVRTAAGPRH